MEYKASSKKCEVVQPQSSVSVVLTVTPDVVISNDLEKKEDESLGSS